MNIISNFWQRAPREILTNSNNKILNDILVIANNKPGRARIVKKKPSFSIHNYHDTRSNLSSLYTIPLVLLEWATKIWPNRQSPNKPVETQMLETNPLYIPRMYNNLLNTDRDHLDGGSRVVVAGRNRRNLVDKVHVFSNLLHKNRRKTKMSWRFFRQTQDKTIKTIYQYIPFQRQGEPKGFGRRTNRGSCCGWRSRRTGILRIWGVLKAARKKYIT